LINSFLLFKGRQIRVVDFIGAMKSSYKEYSELGHRVKNGTLKFKEFDSLTEKKQNWELSLTSLMKFAEMPENACQERRQQIKVFKELKNIMMIIEILMDIREKNNLAGEFVTLTDMHESVSNLKKTFAESSIIPCREAHYLRLCPSFFLAILLPIKIGIFKYIKT